MVLKKIIRQEKYFKIVFILCCCITNSTNLAVQNNAYFLTVAAVRNPAWLTWVLCLGFHKADVDELTTCALTWKIWERDRVASNKRWHSGGCLEFRRFTGTTLVVSLFSKDCRGVIVAITACQEPVARGTDASALEAGLYQQASKKD